MRYKVYIKTSTNVDSKLVAVTAVQTDILSRGLRKEQVNINVYCNLTVT